MPSFVVLTSVHSDAQPLASECPDVKTTNDGLTWSSIGCQMATVSTRVNVPASSVQIVRSTVNSALTCVVGIHGGGGVASQLAG